MRDASIQWFALLALGAAHGINPAMGWLFAVGRGLQERDRRAVWRALGPLAVGHALAIGVAIAAAMAMGNELPLGWLRWVVALSLVTVGVDGLVHHRHVRFAGTTAGGGDHGVRLDCRDRAARAHAWLSARDRRSRRRRVREGRSQDPAASVDQRERFLVGRADRGGSGSGAALNDDSGVARLAGT